MKLVVLIVFEEDLFTYCMISSDWKIIIYFKFISFSQIHGLRDNRHKGLDLTDENFRELVTTQPAFTCRGKSKILRQLLFYLEPGI